jgi:hypothetical protein
VPKQNYHHARKQKEQARKVRKQEKEQRKAARQGVPEESGTPAPEGPSPASTLVDGK